MTPEELASTINDRDTITLLQYLRYKPKKRKEDK